MLVICSAVQSRTNCQDLFFSQDDVLKALPNPREDKVAGADDLSPRFLLHIKEQLSYPLFFLLKIGLERLWHFGSPKFGKQDTNIIYIHCTVVPTIL